MWESRDGPRRIRRGLAVDLGTVTTLVHVSGRGIVVEEPSAIAVDTSSGAVLAVGAEAGRLLGREPAGVKVLQPLREGVIADLDACTILLQALLRRAWPHHSLFRVPAVVCVPSGATGVERRALVAAVEQCRPHCTVTLVEEALAAALGAGAGHDVGGAVVVDVGGGTTELAIVAGGAAVRVQSLRVAGNHMDAAIAHAAKAELGLTLGQRTVERAKQVFGLAGAAGESLDVVGMDPLGTIRTAKLPAHLVAAALEHPVATIVEALNELLAALPPDLAEDVAHGVIWLAGGGALLPGLAARIQQETGVATQVAQDPLRCVVRGAAEILEGRSGAPGSRAA